ncbi:ArnT family glycosyltransferase [Zhouia sp. PK063]|uniref:ArnT family glycosyltransferase n=1 Tax=Zhouia sp. PK063 TaxID=3373602 RepID=UPI00378777D3
MFSFKKTDQPVIVYLILLTIVNLLQSYGTELIFDEAYYWYYSQHLSWGYFDHPPMVALMANIGEFLFPGELGFRFMSPFLLSATFWVLWKIIEDYRKYDHILLFCILTASAGLLNVYGFFMLPDTPLIFFGLLFLYAYKKFLAHKNWKNTLLLGFCMAMIMYSKYQGILLIGFIVLSNLKLLLSKKFWIAIVVAFILFTPYLLWLYKVDFVPIKYHLIERGKDLYKINFTTDTLVNATAIFGFSFPLMYWAFFKEKANSTFLKGLKVVLIGIVAFFILSSFSRRTQAQWFILIAFPLIIFSYKYAFSHIKFRKWLFITGYISIGVMLLLRVFMAFEEISPISYETHGNKKWTAALQKKVGGIPVVFENSYRNASMYAFYTKSLNVFSFNNVEYRKNQYDIDSSEYKLEGKKIAFVSRTDHPDASNFFNVILTHPKKSFQGFFVNDFKSYRKLKIYANPETIQKHKDTINFTIANPYQQNINLNDIEFSSVLFNKKKHYLKTLPLQTLINSSAILKSNDTLTIKAIINYKAFTEETLYIRIGSAVKGFKPGFQGNMIKLNK